jgi:hypothetical protein
VTVISGTKPQILGGTQSAELAEIVIEVRLIGIAMVECQIDPVDVSLLADGKDHVLKALHTAEKFRSHPQFVAKKFDESPLAESDTFSDFRTVSASARICV